MKYPRKASYYWRIEKSTQEMELVKVFYKGRKIYVVSFGRGFEPLVNHLEYDWVIINKPNKNYKVTNHGDILLNHDWVGMIRIPGNKELLARLVNYLNQF